MRSGCEWRARGARSNRRQQETPVLTLPLFLFSYLPPLSFSCRLRRSPARRRPPARLERSCRVVDVVVRRQQQHRGAPLDLSRAADPTCRDLTAPGPWVDRVHAPPPPCALLQEGEPSRPVAVSASPHLGLDTPSAHTLVAQSVPAPACERCARNHLDRWPTGDSNASERVREHEHCGARPAHDGRHHLE